MSTDSGLNSYYTLGRTGLRVSRLALGTMTFGTDWGWGADKETARRLVNAYLEAGGNFFDTADLYTNGTSETWLGEFIAERNLRDRAVIATKFSYNAEPGNPNAGGNGRKHILRAIEGSLRRLGTDYVDLYLLHTWDRVTPTEEVMRTLDDLVRSGTVRHIGLSNIPAWYASRAQTIAELRGYEPVAALQLEYSLAERNIEHEFTTLGTEHGMGIMVWSPLASGGVGSVIVGATKVQQLEENIRALSFDIPAELLQRLDAVSAPERPFPYMFFGNELQGMIHGGANVGMKPKGYTPAVQISGAGAGTSA